MQRVVGQVGRFLAGVGMVIAMTMTSASSAAVKVQQDPNDSALWTLSNGRAEVQVNAKVGRIMHYGFTGGPNLFWTNADPKNPKYDLGGFTNYGGDKIWPWPQDYFGWPPPEPKDGYTVAPGKDGKSLVMTGQVPGYGLKVIRTVGLADDSSTMTVTTTFEPVDTSFTKPIGVWSITQVPTPKRLFVRVPQAADRERFLARAPKDSYEAHAVSPNVVQLVPDPSKGVKTFADADVIAASYDDAVLLLRQIPVHKQGTWVPDQRAQVYSHPAKTDNIPPGVSYAELEWTAPMLLPNQVNHAPLTVIYKAVKLSQKTTPEDIVRMVEQVP